MRGIGMTPTMRHLHQVDTLLTQVFALVQGEDPWSWHRKGKLLNPNMAYHSRNDP